MKSLLVLGVCVALLSSPIAGTSAENNVPAVKVAKANYELATRWTAEKVNRLVFDIAVTPHWLADADRFWYSWENDKGRRFYVVDPVKQTKTLLFEPADMAAKLTAVTGLPYDAQHLPIRTIKFVKNETTLQFDINVPRDAEIPGVKASTDDQEGDQQQGGGGGGGRQGAARQPGAQATKTVYFEYELAGGKLTVLPERPPHKMRWASISPDGKTVVFARKYNLYMMDADNYVKAQKKPDDSSIAEAQLTTDGEENFSYARRLTDQERTPLRRDQGKEKEPRVPSILVHWSKDSKKFAVTRMDQRKVKDLWVINSLANPRPTLETYRYAMPGETDVPQTSFEVFDRESKARLIVKADKFKDQTIVIETDPVGGRARELEKTEPLWAGPDSAKLYFARVSRDMHKTDICVVDTGSGEVKSLIEERMNVYIETRPLRVVNNGTELLHWSERDGWGHYYLYDANGTLKSRVTKGEYVTEDVTGVDDKARVAFITAAGREENDDPYYPHLYRVSYDGTASKLLDPGNAAHAVLMSDSGRYFVDNSSRVDSAPVAVLCDNTGAKVLDLEAVDVTALKAAGFKFPEPFQVKADDGITELSGVMYKPFDFDPNKKYPIIAHVYPGPQTEQVNQTFTPRNPNVTLAQLGFIVIQVGNRGGNPRRSKWYHTFGYGNLRDYGLADKKAAIEQLAERFPYIDITRVGIYGHSGGGFMSTAAMLIYPDFFKVAVSSSGNHENNVYNRWWSEKHHGVKEITDDKGNVKFEYTIDKNSELAKNLKGRLLLATGDIDDNVHPANTFRLADALIKANKRFDLVVLPGKRHAYTDDTEYFFWVRADYFCHYLLGDWDQAVDMSEINNDRPQNGRRPTAGRGQEEQQQNQ